MSAQPYQQINLYQPIFRRQRQIFSAVTMLQALGVVVSALLTIYAYGLWQVRGIEAGALQLEGRERAYSTQLARLDPRSSADQRNAAEQELERLTAMLASQQGLIEELQEQPLGSASGFSELLTALARQRAPGLWLTQIAINRASSAIELVGRSISPDIVPTYLLKLGDEDALAGHRFDDFSIERSIETSAVTFRVSSRAITAGSPDDRMAQR